MAHTVIPPPRGTTAILELTHKGNINDKTIPERDREVRDFDVTLLASAITFNGANFERSLSESRQTYTGVMSHI